VNAPLAPIAASGNNVYAIWWSNKTGNYEVFLELLMIMESHLIIK
jgi:hypothetical protein